MKKRIVTLFFSLMLAFTLAACGSNQKSPSSSSTEPKSTPSVEKGENSTVKKNGKSLVVYFSMPETAKPNNMSREEELSTVVVNGKVLGNTQYVAEVIQKNTGSDIFRIEPKTPYPMNHSELEEVATKEKNKNARPTIAGKIENIGQYDTIFLGYPNWYADMPMILYSFLEEYNLSGKTIIPFVTSGGSGFSNTINAITKLQLNANVVKNGISVSRNDAEKSESDIIEWLNKNGYTKK